MIWEKLMPQNIPCREFIKNLPKAELHVHIEGTMEPTELIMFADRNGIDIPDDIVDQTNNSYIFTSPNSFINAYLKATEVLHSEQDFYDLTYAYLRRISTQGVLHTEIFFDLQTYMPRNISPAIIINGMHHALIDAKKQLGTSGFLIMCFLRHLSQDDAFKALELLKPFGDKVIGVGLATIEKNNPPSKFKEVFAQARAYGYRAVAHVAEGPTGADMIRQALTELHIQRIDHGIGCMSDPTLMQELVEKKIPLTVCPLSNVALGYFDTLADHPLKAMFNAGLTVSINSDDPAFLGGYIADNYRVAADVLDMPCNDLVQCARYSFISSFLNETDKQACLNKLDDYAAKHVCVDEKA